MSINNYFFLEKNRSVYNATISKCLEVRCRTNATYQETFPIECCSVIG